MDDMDNFLHLAKCITRDLRMYGGDLPFPPLLLWKEDINFYHVKKAWQNVIKRILQEKNNYDRLGLYVHIPFCLTKCFYCNCISFQETSQRQHTVYLDCLENEIKLLDFPKNVAVKTVYIGGGTPSILSLKNLERLFTMLYNNFRLDECQQIMTEISSQTGSLEKIKLLKDFGVNKVTIGVQSLDPRTLKRANRIQSSKSVFASYQNARKVGISYINIDLMAGLPSQTPASFKKTLEVILKLKPDTIHINPFFPNQMTAFYRSGQRLTPTDIARRIKMVKLANEIIGLRYPYAFERDTLEKENMQIFNSKKFNSSLIGLGYAAMSHAFNNLHYAKQFDFGSYVNRSKNNRFPHLMGHRLNEDDEMRANVITGLENDGHISKRIFRQLFGRDVEVIFNKEINFLMRIGKLKEDVDTFRMTSKVRLDQFLYSKVFYDRKAIERFKRMIDSRRETYSNVDLDLMSLYD